ncbi:precorrin-3B synthase [Rhizobium sp. BK529]|uniref:precorrin-3B synthase n=1 Tax=unclassified Rhizobium TaxID=2613769 RepID=UPI001043126A|nr:MULTISPECIES: precorrin-3B synthase [unclassified Rhizobium]MBB3593852.1 precorrin-3B synthase [Rhizobium sp. BK529]TCS01309.1 precorrin-3B synthase [Rhizobium sp. BK418]
MRSAHGKISNAEKAYIAGMQRGACPTLAAPMQTGDGLLVRLRPAGGALTIAQLRELASAAARHGNGILEITARGNLQIRGLSTDTVRPLAAEIDAAGIVVPDGVTIEISPLHGIDGDAIGDAAVMEAAVRSKLGVLLNSPHLAPKLSILVDGGGRFSLSALIADIRIVAQQPGQWLLSIAGDEETATPLAIGGPEAVAAAAGDLLELLTARGRQTRPRDIAATTLYAHFPQIDSIRSIPPAPSRSSYVGVTRLRTGIAVLGVRLKFGQARAADLISFLASAESAGAREIRLAPDRGFFLIGLPESEMPAMQQAAVDHGFSVTAKEPAEQIAACAGAGACASAFYDTRALASQLIDRVPDLFDGSLKLHLSGCAKGCAHRRADLVIAGSTEGYGFVLDGLAANSPAARIAGGRIDFAIEKLARLIEDKRGAGESSADCLKRLGPIGLAEALQQE